MSTGHFQKLPQNGKFMIGSIPETGEEAITVEAQFNPKELQIESPIGWAEHKAIGHQSVATKPMEFTGMGVETLKIELTFDSFEDEERDEVVEKIAQLKKLASVRLPNQPSSKGKAQRPSFCVATWGTQQPFRCVIDSINVKYTMFSFDGTPVRATVVLGLKSGCRPVDHKGETSFERDSRERMDSQREKLQGERKLYQAELTRQHDEEMARVKQVKEQRAQREAQALREQRKRDFQLE